MSKRLNNIYGLYESAVKFLQPVTIADTYAIIAKEAVRISGANYASILLREKSRFIIVYTTNPLLGKIKPRKEGYIYKVYKTGKPKILKGEDLRRAHSEFTGTKIKSDLVVPLENRGKSMGALAVTSETKEFTREDMANLQLLASLSMLSIRKAQLYADLEKEIETRDLFISLASHELKTPITTVSTFVQLMQRRLAKGEKLNTDWVEHILDEMARLTKLIDELLELDRIKSGRLEYEFEPSSLKEIVKHAIMSFKANHQQRKVVFKDGVGVTNDTVIADFNKMIEVVINLLDNAAKYSAEENSIIVKIESPDKKYTTVSVEDKGKGIPKKDLPKIFNSFYKGENHTIEGMGLGLYLSKQIIDRHNGKIKISSELDRGTMVKLTLPTFYYERTRKNTHS